MSFEKPTSSTGEESSLEFMRHSKANYDRMTEETVDNPLKKVSLLSSDKVEDYKDLSDSGKELARAEAEKMLEGMNPETDVLYIAASPAERAVQTASIVLKLATKDEARRFTIVEHGGKGLEDAVQNEAVESRRQIRTFPALASLDMKVPAWIADLFTDAKTYSYDSSFDGEPLTNQNFNKIFAGAWASKEEGGQLTQEQQNAWRRAKQIILNNDMGSWGENFYHHSARIMKEFKDEFPELIDPVENSRKQLAVMTRMFKWGIKNFKENPQNKDKNLKVLVFGHEESLTVLEEVFGEGGHSIKNCEVISFTPHESGAYTLNKGNEERNAVFSHHGDEYRRSSSGGTIDSGMRYLKEEGHLKEIRLTPRGDN